MTIAYFDCFSGAGGDMLLSSLLDAGLPLAELEADLARLEMGPYRLEVQRVTRRGLTGTQLRVLTEADHYPAVNLAAVEEIVGGSGLPPRIQERSLAVFRRLARAEAAVHGVGIQEIHFHEIGAVDSLVDIVGFVCALERLGIERVYSSPLAVGSGTVETMHGRLPVPAPATLALLAEAGAPTVPGPAQTEILTPTGAALLTEFATFVRPAMYLRAVGYGFGSKEFAWPNALRLWLGDPLEATLPESPTVAGDLADSVVELRCNLDDADGEVLGYALEQLLEAGALDVWFTPIQMKKNRPATMLSVLARPADAERLTALLLRETPTLGVRRQVLARRKAARRVRRVETPWGEVRVKVKLLDGEEISASPEYEDCARLAAAHGVPLMAVMEAARVAGQTGRLHPPSPASAPS